MQPGPFPPDDARRQRYEALTADVTQAVEGVVTHDGRILAADVAALMAEHGLAGPEAVMLHALPAAATRSEAPISGYRVGAVGLEMPTGDLLLEANLEFPGGDLRMTIHAEGAVAVRSFARGTAVATLALTQARPCASCRQALMEFAWAAELSVIDRAGHRLTLADLYPWPTIGPLQAAIVALQADGDGYAAIESAYLATRPEGAVDDARSTRDLLGVTAPGVHLHVASWS